MTRVGQPRYLDVDGMSHVGCATVPAAAGQVADRQAPGFAEVGVEEQRALALRSRTANSTSNRIRCRALASRRASTTAPNVTPGDAEKRPVSTSDQACELVIVVTKGIDHERSSVAFTIANSAITAGLEVYVFLTRATIGRVRKRGVDLAKVSPLDPLKKLITDLVARGAPSGCAHRVARSAATLHAIFSKA